jgi:hypothetical protein
MSEQISIAQIRAKFPQYKDLTDDQLVIGIRKAYYPDIPIQEFSKRIRYTAPDPTEGMSTFDKFVAGYGKAGADLYQGGKQAYAGVADFLDPRAQTLGSLITGEKVRSRVDEQRAEVEQTRRRDAPLMETGAGATGNFLGNIAPMAAIPGAATVRGGLALGAGLGVIQPSAGTGETIGNMALGAAGGAVVPGVVHAYRAAKSAAEPFYEAGKNAIVGRALNRAAGKDAPVVANRLREASTPFAGPSQGTPRTVMGEYVPGSVPTVGQAAENAGVASLERAATATNPEVTNAVSDVMRSQNAARVGVLDDMAGTDGRRLFAEQMREGTAGQLYGQARTQGIDPAKLTPQVTEQLQKLSSRVPEEVFAKARQLAKINGQEMTDANSVQGMHWMKLAIDDLMGAADRAGNSTLKGAYAGLQRDFLGMLDNLSPAYQNARGTYAQMSRPINQMDVAGDIMEKSVDKLTGNLQPRSYARAATSDATAARATGFPGATMQGTMEPAQMNALQSILLDLQRSTAAQNAGRGAGSDTVQKLAYTNMLDQAGVPTFLRNFAPAQLLGNVGARGADLAYGRANRELGNRLAEVMLDPAQASQLMLTAGPTGVNPLAQLLIRSGSGLGASVPALTNSHKQ